VHLAKLVQNILNQLKENTFVGIGKNIRLQTLEEMLNLFDSQNFEAYLLKQLFHLFLPF
jgi:hypothetical protein